MKKFILIYALFISILNFSNAQWEECKGLSGKSVRCIAIKGDTIFAGTWGEGVFVSDNNGDSWTPKNNGLTNLIVNSISILENNILIGTFGAGIFLSTDNGENWIAKNNGIELLEILSLAINDNKIFAGEIGLYYSTDKGNNWIFWDIGTYIIYSIDISNDTVIVGTDYGIFLSTDNGQNWSNKITDEIFNRDIYSIAICNNDYVAGIESLGIFISSDYGSTWIAKNDGLTNLNIYTIANIRNYIFAGSGKGIFLTSNLGDSWKEKNDGLTNLHINTIIIDSNRIFAGTFGGLFKSSISKLTSTGLINNIVENSFELFPNPVNDILNIKYINDKQIKFKIINLLGVVVKQGVLTREQKIINISELPFGIYLFIFGNETKKFIKQ